MFNSVQWVRNGSGMDPERAVEVFVYMSTLDTPGFSERLDNCVIGSLV